MVDSPKLNLRCPAAIRDALDAYCRAEGLVMSQLVLTAICEKIGRPDLLGEIRAEGRPKKTTE